MDLIPEIKVTVFREGEAEPSLPIEEPVDKVEEKKAARAKPEVTGETDQNSAPAEA
jgi:hypothetical protein